jgi:glutathione S-transferase
MAGGSVLADVLLTSCLDWAVAYGVALPPGLAVYRKQIRERAAYRRALAVNFGKGG